MDRLRRECQPSAGGDPAREPPSLWMTLAGALLYALAVLAGVAGAPRTAETPPPSGAGWCPDDPR